MFNLDPQVRKMVISLAQVVTMVLGALYFGYVMGQGSQQNEIAMHKANAEGSARILKAEQESYRGQFNKLHTQLEDEAQTNAELRKAHNNLLEDNKSLVNTISVLQKDMNKLRQQLHEAQVQRTEDAIKAIQRRDDPRSGKN